IRVGPGGQFILDEDARLLPLAAHLEVTPTVSNFGGGRFRRELALPLIATAEARADAARHLRKLCQERGYAGINLDLEALQPRDFDGFAALVEALSAELRPRGFFLSVDVPV